MNYYIQGDPSRAKEIKAAFESKGIDTSSNSNYGISNLFYYSCNGEVAVTQNGSIINIIKTHPDYQELELPDEPKFKVGDRVIYDGKVHTITFMDDTYYDFDGGVAGCRIDMQDKLKLAPKPHYDIANFKPYDRVLVRDGDLGLWKCNIFSDYYDNFYCFRGTWEQCIPFEGNEALLGTTDPCGEEYINW